MWKSRKPVGGIDALIGVGGAFHGVAKGIRRGKLTQEVMRQARWS